MSSREWGAPPSDRAKINWAGKQILKPAPINPSKQEEFDYFRQDLDAWILVNEWRSAHAYPLNTIQVNLRRSCMKFDPKALVAQRIKRYRSIVHKLQRFPNMRLTQMQDLGGCRAILDNADAVEGLAYHYRFDSRAKHVITSIDDYMNKPKESGYRGIHLIFKYFSENKKTEIYNGMKIEMQLRSKSQHSWATAVETVGTFSGQALKSSMGSEEWQRFFALMSSTIARREARALVPGTPTDRSELVMEIAKLEKRLGVVNRLIEYSRALKTIENFDASHSYFILSLDAASSRLNIIGYKNQELGRAEEDYGNFEKQARENPMNDAVLVSVESIKSLKKAYPNYFADTTDFLRLVRLVVKSSGIEQ